MKRIHKGDEVIVTTGRSKGQRGHVLRVLGEDRMLVENVNMVKKHQKPNQKNPQGGIVDKDMPIHVSKVMLLDAKTDKPTRVRQGTDAEGKKVRVTVKSGTVLS